jgi:NADH:ubiquinone oxidoreductase subunit 4 (subunit M)
VGSVILAALLLKLGGFGYLRFMLPLFNPAVHNYYWPLVVCLSGSSIVLASLTAVRQLDMKRVIAYSSIAHMNIAVLGIFSNSVSALSGSLIIMISHGFISSAMFLLIGVLYDRYHSRLIYHYSGLASTMPIFATILIMASLGNIGFPLTYNYVGEFGVIVGLTGLNIYYGFIGSLGVFLGAVYTM